MPFRNLAGREHVYYDGAPVQFRPRDFGLHYHHHPGEASKGLFVDGGAVPGAIRSHDYGPVFAGQAKRIRWDRIETTDWSSANAATIDADPGWQPFDAFISAYGGASVPLFHTLYGTHWRYSQDPNEAWAYNPTPVPGQGGGAKPPTDLAAGVSSSWGRYCAGVGRRTATLGANLFFETSNEPNLQTLPSRFYSGTQSELAQMVRIASQSIKAVNPAAKCLTPAVVSLHSTGTGLAFFNGMMVASDGAGGDMRDWVDGIAFHAYPPGNSEWEVHKIVGNVRAAMATLGVAALPLYNTEFGLLSPEFSQLDAATRVDKMMRMHILARCHPLGGCDASVWYDADSPNLGMTAGDAAKRAEHKAFLAQAGGVTQVSGTSDGRLRVVCNGIERVI